MGLDLRQVRKYKGFVIAMRPGCIDEFYVFTAQAWDCRRYATIHPEITASTVRDCETMINAVLRSQYAAVLPGFYMS